MSAAFERRALGLTCPKKGVGTAVSVANKTLDASSIQ